MLRRMDGEFTDQDDSAEGWAGQPSLGELAGEVIDCRWIGSLVATKS